MSHSVQSESQPQCVRALKGQSRSKFASEILPPIASHGTSPTPPPTATSQSYKSSIQNLSIIGQSNQNMLVVGQSSPLYQPNIYHPHVYALYYTQTPYSYNMQPSMQSPALAGPMTSSFVPAAMHQSEPSSIPMVALSEERKSPVLVK